MSAKRASIVAAAVALVAVLAVGIVQLSSTDNASTAPSPLTLAQMRARLAASPPRLAALHAQANELLPGGLKALRARLAALRGRAIVINKWASWCQPCQAEFGAFQRASVALGREVAFLGVDSSDTSRTAALAFLRTHPLSYPSYYDPSGEAGTAITDSSFTPVTVFYDDHGGEFIHQGPYPSQAKLERDVERYALEA
jgi:cytochrome c biogenesis protein CcmG, thiol:disulfide interchange protein DsbE